jgi:hypothetical protein
VSSMMELVWREIDADDPIWNLGQGEGLSAGLSGSNENMGSSGFVFRHFRGVQQMDNRVVH